MYIAHRTEDGREQPLIDHLRGTARLCEAFAQPFGAGALGRELGLAHDAGKYSRAFQRRIRGEDVRVDHSTAGAQEIAPLFGWYAAYCVAGHHGGLPDGGSGSDVDSCPTLCGRLKRRVEPHEDFAREVSLERVGFRLPRYLGKRGFTMSFFVRMLFSCLVDADFLDTEAFCQKAPPPRGSALTVQTLLARLDAHTAKWKDPKAPPTDLNLARNRILHACEEAGEALAPGLFTLTVPTGGGKTVSSLAFALHHARAHGKRRIVYVIPYTSVIEQTADKFREILGSEAVLEHHSNVDFGDDGGESPDPEKERKKLASENWDMPVVVTTAVQFFESLFANRPSKCRKLHNLADSVIIFDEAQTIPLKYLLPCVRAIAELTANYGASCVLCTATQPALGPLFEALSPELAPREIAPALPAEVFRRVRYEALGRLSDEELTERLNAHERVLCIVNTRKQAQAIYRLLDPQGSYHLSTLMTPQHRREMLTEIRKRLDEKEPCRVVSTSLIEAGVDVDFPVVYRAEAGLDSLVQAAGRCNREGRNAAEESPVYIFRPDAADSGRLPASMRRPLETMRSALRAGAAPDDPRVIERYFTDLRRFSGPDIDKLSLVDRFEEGVQDPFHPAFPFAEAARDFRLIDQSTRAILIPCRPEAEELAMRLRGKERSRALLRKVGLHTVNVYAWQLDALRALGALEPVEDELFILTDLSRYDERIGLVVPEEGGAGIFM